MFSHTTGLIERPPAGSALSPNVVAVPMERLAEFVNLRELVDQVLGR